MAGIEVIIPVRDEEENLPYALASVVPWAKRVWVVDSGSTDRTVEMARDHGAEVVEQSWLGHAAQKNWAIDNLPLTSDWVFFLDADESVLPELRDEMLAVSSRDPATVEESAFNVNRYFIFLGKRIRHCGYYPSWNVRFFKRGSARYEDRAVHEHMVVDGTVGAFRGHMEHFDRRGLAVYLAKHVRYAELEAAAILSQDDRSSSIDGDMQRRRRWIKRHIYPRLPAKWLCRFLWMYVLRLGFLDGLTGLRFCVFISFYEFLITLNLVELRNEESMS